MKLQHKIGCQLFLLITPIVTTCAIGTFSAEAATLARSQAEFFLSNFSHDPFADSTVAAVTEDTTTIIERGLVTASADGEAAFFVDPVASAFNTSLSTANGGTGGKYTGTALSSATVQGIFSVAANDTFSFDYSGFLNLAVAVDQPGEESATAFGDISLQLINVDTDAIVDEFNVFKFLSSRDGNAEINQILSGQYSRLFDTATTFALVETKTNLVEVVKVPEASTTLALLLVSGAGYVLTQQRRLAKR
jgi:hypothetical protein